MAVERFRVIAIDETHNWDEAVLAERHIAVAFGLYLIREGERTHCCSLSASSWAVALSNQFIFDFDLDPAKRAEVIDAHLHEHQDGAAICVDPLEALRSAPYDAGLEHEGLDDCYLDYVEVASYDRRFITERVSFKVDSRQYGGTKSEAYHDAVWDEAREYFQGNAHEPGILNPGVYMAYMAEVEAKARAENRRVLAMPALPLFMVAAERMGVQTWDDARALGWL